MNIPFGQFRRVKKNCTSQTTYEEQSVILRHRFEEKGYPKPLIQEAYERASKLSQEEVLKTKPNEIQNKANLEGTSARSSNLNKPGENPRFYTNFITTFNDAHPTIRNIQAKRWSTLHNDPILKDLIPAKPSIMFRRAPAVKNLLAPSRLKQHKETPSNLLHPLKNGSFKCGQPRCKCCTIIKHNKTHFLSRSKEVFPIKYHLICQSQFIIYLVECICGHQYVGSTTQKLHLRLNKHRSNIKKGFLQHSVSRHIFNQHPGVLDPISIIPIDFIPPFISDKFEKLKKRDVLDF